MKMNSNRIYLVVLLAALSGANWQSVNMAPFRLNLEALIDDPYSGFTYEQLYPELEGQLEELSIEQKGDLELLEKIFLIPDPDEEDLMKRIKKGNADENYLVGHMKDIAKKAPKFLKSLDVEFVGEDESAPTFTGSKSIDSKLRKLRAIINEMPSLNRLFKCYESAIQHEKSIPHDELMKTWIPRLGVRSQIIRLLVKHAKWPKVK